MGVKAQKFLVFDKGKEEIDNHIVDHKHNFIVMSSNGKSSNKTLIGTNIQSVVRNSAIPVFVVKKKLEISRIDNIIFASAFQQDVYKSFYKIIEFANLINAQIHLLNVNVPFQFKETHEAEANMKAFAKNNQKGKFTINTYSALNEERGIQKFAEKTGADVIAVTTDGKTGFIKMISPSITESLVNHSEIPVLSVNTSI